MQTPIVMHGAAGRMGRRILALAAAAPADFTIVAGVDLRPGRLTDLGLDLVAPLLQDLPDHPGAVVIDFSRASAVASVLQHCARCGMPCAVGTTGVEPAILDQALAAAAERIPVLAAPNMSLGVTVVMAMAARIAAALGLDYDVEIVEAHHGQKIDAPSGTALGLADAIAGATGRGRQDLIHGRSGTTGERRRGEIGMHALRMGDVVGDHTAWFVGNGERISIAHQAHTRDIFARGALRAAAFLAGAAPGRYTMADVLGLG
jgi:4-hydroxy-tetrahydrodipicolinate reductase